MDKESEEAPSPSKPEASYASAELSSGVPGAGANPETDPEATRAITPKVPVTVPAEEEEEEGGPIKTFLEHLEDLRWVFIRVAAALGIAMVGCMAGAPKIVEFLRWPLLIAEARLPGDNELIELQPLGPLGPFVITMKLALYGGITLALPFILYFVGDFVMPALKKHEKVFFLRAFIVGAGLFMLGVTICYFFVLPMTLKATIQYSAWMDFRPEFWRAEEYFSFVTLLMVCMGASFELPIVILSLVKVGLIEYEWLTKGRPYFFIVTFALVAFITPDFVSTFFLVIPMMLLMEACIWIAWWWKRKEGKEALQSGRRG
jgi:sec-independent protein translocase protein TatC